MHYHDISKLIDHSLLPPSLTESELQSGCELAVAYEVASVCILPYYLRRCAEILRGSGVKASTTIGFPHGGHTTAVKVAEAKQALGDGGEELDMVVNISQVRSGNWNYVANEIAQIVDVAHAAQQKVKVIFENYYLDEEQKIRLCQICSEVRADWVKTSTGYAAGGATLDDVRLMRQHSASHVQVKAAGGVRDLDTVLQMRELGVTRVGASRTAEILDVYRQRLGLPAIVSSTAAHNGSGY